MSVDKDTVYKVARLARLHVNENEIDSLSEEMSRIVEFVDQLAAVDVEGVEPMAHPLDIKQALRKDEVTESDRRDAFQAIAPSVDDGLYLVPRVIE